VWITGLLPSVLAQVKDILENRLRVTGEDVSIKCTKPNDQLVVNQFNLCIEALHKQKYATFKQMKFLWKNMYRMETSVTLDVQNPRFTVSGRMGDVERFRAHTDFFSTMLMESPIIRDPDHFKTFESFVLPANTGPNDREFRERLYLVTRADVSPIVLWSMAEGPTATRETRMMLVARIAVQQFGCRLSGGFVRDWIVKGFKEHPPNLPDPAKPFDNEWIETCTKGFIKYDIKEGVLPKDIDAELSSDMFFDVQRFISTVRAAGVTVDFHEHVAQRHVFTFECARGPFSMDCVEFHFAALHSMADFDVNMLTLMSPCEGTIGLKVPWDALKVDEIIERIHKSEMWRLRPIAGTMQERLDKMKGRGWTIVDTREYVPVEHENSVRSSLTQVFKEDPDYANYFEAIAAMNRTGVTIYRIENANMTQIYEGVRARIAAENGGDANERTLFYGTKKDAALGILHSGFDDRYWNGGNGATFGRAAYFAPIPAMADNFTDRGAGVVRWIFVCKVTLGFVESIPPQNVHYLPKSPYHSSTGRETHWFPNEDQFMVYRYGQALPLLLIRYTV
jgi:hypothetical protein